MRLLKKGTKLYSIIHLKCPKCQEGNLFINANPYNLTQFDKMYKNCLNCNENFSRENGFYWGAMMISHATTTIIGVVVHYLFFLRYGWDKVEWSIGITILLMVILMPIIFRNSRAIWINIFVDYDKEKDKSNIGRAY